MVYAFFLSLRLRLIRFCFVVLLCDLKCNKRNCLEKCSEILTFLELNQRQKIYTWIYNIHEEKEADVFLYLLRFYETKTFVRNYENFFFNQNRQRILWINCLSKYIEEPKAFYELNLLKKRFFFSLIKSINY